MEKNSVAAVAAVAAVSRRQTALKLLLRISIWLVCSSMALHRSVCLALSDKTSQIAALVALSYHIIPVTKRVRLATMRPASQPTRIWHVGTFRCCCGGFCWTRNCDQNTMRKHRLVQQALLLLLHIRPMSSVSLAPPSVMAVNLAPRENGIENSGRGQNFLWQPNSIFRMRRMITLTSFFATNICYESVHRFKLCFFNSVQPAR